MIEMKVEFDEAKLNKLLNQVPGMVQRSAFEKGFRPAGRVIERRLAELTPSSERSGSRNKWSDKVKGERSGVLPLNKTTATKVWRTGNGNAMVLVGFKWPSGNLAHILFSDWRHTMWGKITNIKRVKSLDLLKRAFDDTKSQSTAAFTTAVAKDIPKQLARLGRG